MTDKEYVAECQKELLARGVLSKLKEMVGRNMLEPQDLLNWVTTASLIADYNGLTPQELGKNLEALVLPKLPLLSDELLRQLLDERKDRKEVKK